MVQKFDQEKARDLINKLRRHARYMERLGLDDADQAADIIEDLMMNVYGIQERLNYQEVNTGDKL